MKLTTTITITRAGTEVEVPVVGHWSSGEKADFWSPGESESIEVESINGAPAADFPGQTVLDAEGALWDAAADRLETERAQEEDADEARRERFIEALDARIARGDE